MDLVNVKLSLDDIYIMLNSVNEYVDKVIVRINFAGFFFKILSKLFIQVW
jgi:hypothetical protein